MTTVTSGYYPPSPPSGPPGPNDIPIPETEVIVVTAKRKRNTDTIEISNRLPPPPFGPYGGRSGAEENGFRDMNFAMSSPEDRAIALGMNPFASSEVAREDEVVDPLEIDVVDHFIEVQTQGPVVVKWDFGYEPNTTIRREKAESLARTLASLMGKKGAERGGTNTEGGMLIFEREGRIIAHSITIGSSDTVPVTGYALNLMRSDPSLNLLWVVHNHPGGSPFSASDIQNGQTLATSSNPQLSSFQGLLLGQPSGSVEEFLTENLRGL